MNTQSETIPLSGRPTLWDVSALFYRHTYDEAAHSVDDTAIAAVTDALRGGVVVDAGCGPGVVVPAFLKAGAGRVLAVDISQAMLAHIARDSKVTTIAADLQPGAFASIRREHAPAGFNVVWFKRSLYHEDDVATPLLQDAFDNLAPGGRIVVIHPESSLRRYLFQRRNDRLHVSGYTLYHAFNRALSVGLRRLRVHNYKHRTEAELLKLGKGVRGGTAVLVPSPATPFNILVIRRDASS